MFPLWLSDWEWLVFRPHIFFTKVSMKVDVRCSGSGGPVRGVGWDLAGRRIVRPKYVRHTPTEGGIFHKLDSAKLLFKTIILMMSTLYNINRTKCRCRYSSTIAGLAVQTAGAVKVYNLQEWRNNTVGVSADLYWDTERSIAREQEWTGTGWQLLRTKRFENDDISQDYLTKLDRRVEQPINAMVCCSRYAKSFLTLRPGTQLSSYFL